MTRPALRDFVSSRRSAIAVTMAIALVPLILLIGIAVDITFLSQARTQTAFASEAAAASATRIAAATYALEVSQGTASTTAAQLAINAANEAGNDWFTADLGNYVRGTLVSGPSTNTTYDGATNGSVNTSAPPNFSASVTSATSYPPIFDPIFGSTKNWVYNSGASATTQFGYAQILLVLDTSGSMLIGADSPDITALQEDTVCPNNTWLSATNTGNEIPGGFALSAGNYAPNDNGAVPNDNDQVTLLSTVTPNYAGNYSTTGTAGACKSGYGLVTPNYYFPGPAASYTGTTPGSPCALACHWAPTPTGGGFSPDYYGIARRNSSTINLRIDILFKATEEVIQDMETSEAVASQYSVGVYQFNTDVYSIVNGNTGSNASNQPEATTDLASALTAVNGDDYKQNPSETVIPQIINSNTVTASLGYANEGGDTDFPLAIQDLEAGNASALSSSNKLQPMTSSGSGATASTPQKFMIIVTDGFEDDSSNNGGPNAGNAEGEMTSFTNEAAGTGVCSYLKNKLGYTLYVLYVQYYPVASLNYYNTASGIGRYLNSYTTTDYPSSFQNASVQQLTETPSAATSPTVLALQSCASSTSDFAQASDSVSIQTALQQLLQKALSSTIRLTN